MMSQVLIFSVLVGLALAGLAIVAVTHWRRIEPLMQRYGWTIYLALAVFSASRLPDDLARGDRGSIAMDMIGVVIWLLLALADFRGSRRAS